MILKVENVVPMEDSILLTSLIASLGISPLNKSLSRKRSLNRMQIFSIDSKLYFLVSSSFLIQPNCSSGSVLPFEIRSAIEISFEESLSRSDYTSLIKDDCSNSI